MTMKEGLSAQERFLAQNVKDAWRDFEHSLESAGAQTWDWVVVTASNERQAEGYRRQLDARLEEGRLPRGARYLVIPDTGGRRIGSGGATFNAYAAIAESVGASEVSSQKILLIHSGGDSKRAPQYSSRGKMFAPAPHVLPNGSIATLFDDLMVAAAGVPARIQGGTLVLPSDTSVVFSPLQLDLESSPAAGLSMKASASEGSDHGVFLAGAGGKVARFLHKLPERTLRDRGAVDGYGQVDVDTGCIWLGKPVVESLVGLVAPQGRVDEERLARFAGPEACLRLYADFLFPLATEAALEEYLGQAPEGSATEELDACRRELWAALSGLDMDLIRLSPSRYVHFGTTWEALDLFTKRVGDYSYLGWTRQVGSLCEADCSPALSNALVERGAVVSDSAYIENATVERGARVGEGAIVSGIAVPAGRVVPDGVAVHGCPLEDGRWVCRAYGVEDNPKESSSSPFLGATLDEVMERTGVSRESLWSRSPASIWNAEVYPVCDTREAALDAALSLCRIARGAATADEVAAWRRAPKASLNSSFNSADVEREARDACDMEDAVRVAAFAAAVAQGAPSAEASAGLGSGLRLAGRLERAFDRAVDSAFPLNMRLLLALSDAVRAREDVSEVRGMDADALEDMAYGIVRDGVVGAVRDANPLPPRPLRFARERVAVDLPVRVNFCGSPSDAAPYCLEHGGTMLDAALLLKGALPVHAEAERLDGCEVVLESSDQSASARFADIGEVRRCGDPRDPFALHKACLAASGILDGFETLEGFCESAGGGIRLSTSVDVPKGSGLGTSSILAAACIKALCGAFGVDCSDDAVYDCVFAAEQMMGTGGGWQDQVGGLSPGIKYFTSRPGMLQRIDVELLDLDDRTLRELEDRFVLVFSGQRRLARNVLRAEMNQCVRNDRGAMAAVARIRELCALMRFHLLNGDVTAFARCMDEQLEHVKLLDKGATNTCVDYIFEVCADLVEGRSVCGAGGGGFLQMILKEGVSREQLEKRIRDEFRGCGVEVWDAGFYFADDMGEEAGR